MRKPFILNLLILAMIGFSCQNQQGSEQSTSNKAIESGNAVTQKSDPNGDLVDLESIDYSRPFDDMVPEQSFEIDADKDIRLVTAKGMKVFIPKGSLVHADDSKVKGKAVVKVKEYYTASEIILSGINMCYTEGGEKYSFESDGMFSIEAVQENNPLKIADGQTIQLDIKRSKNGDDFKFYDLNGQTWSENANNALEEVSSIAEMEVLEKPEYPSIITPKKFNSNYYTIENDKRFISPDRQKDGSDIYITQINIDVNENPWIMDQSKWKFDRHLRLLKYRDKDKRKTQQFDTIPYTRIMAIRGENKYREIIEQNEMALAKYEKELALYQENYEERRKAGLLTATEVFSNVVLSKFGSYNIDRYYSMNQELVVEKRFKLNFSKKWKKKARIYLVAQRLDKLFPVDLSVYNPTIRFSKGERNALLVMRNNKMYALPAAKFKETAKAQLNEEYFEFDIEEFNFADGDSFEAKLEGLF